MIAMTVMLAGIRILQMGLSWISAGPTGQLWSTFMYWQVVHCNAFRNDIDTVGVKAGCTLTGFSDSSFSGKKMSISAVHVEK